MRSGQDCFVCSWALPLPCSPPFPFTFTPPAIWRIFLFRGRCFWPNAKARRPFATDFKGLLHLHFIRKSNNNYQANLWGMGAPEPQLFAKEEEDYHRHSAPWQNLCQEPKPTLPLPHTKTSLPRKTLYSNTVILRLFQLLNKKGC